MDKEPINTLEVQIIRYQESSELFQHMSIVEDEKRNFKTLIEVKPNL
jgi:hypothetical protein